MRTSSGARRVMVLCVLLMAVSAFAAPDPQALYATHCASCHGADRLGGMGPALLPENLERLKRADAVKVIANGRAATQMPGFATDALGGRDRGAGGLRVREGRAAAQVGRSGDRCVADRYGAARQPARPPAVRRPTR